MEKSFEQGLLEFVFQIADTYLHFGRDEDAASIMVLSSKAHGVSVQSAPCVSSPRVE